jgi:hypothetical protein
LGTAIHYQSVGSPGSRAPLPQRPRRQHPAITETARAIDDEDLAIAPHPQVLQTIIGEDDVDPSRNQLSCRGHTVARDEGQASGMPMENQRLIADVPPT